MKVFNITHSEEERINRTTALLFVFSFIIYNYASYVKIGPIPPAQYIVALGSLSALFLTFRNRSGINCSSLFLIICPLILLLVQILSDYSLQRLNVQFEMLKPIMKFIPLAIISYYAGKHIKLEKVFVLWICTILISSIVAILQHFGFQSMGTLRELMGDRVHEVMVRPPGLHYFCLTLAYALSVTVPMCQFLIMKYRGNKKYIFIFIQIILCFATIVTRSRSAILSCLIFFFLWTVFKTKRYKETAVLLLLLFLVLQVPIINNQISPNIFNFSHRLAIYQVAAGVGFENLFTGIGSNLFNYSGVVQEYIGRNNLGHLSSFTGNFSPHSYPINIWLQYGIMGVITYISALVFWIKKVISLNDYDIKLLFILIFIGLFVNSLVHNAGFFNHFIFVYFFYCTLGYCDRIINKELKSK